MTRLKMNEEVDKIQSLEDLTEYESNKLHEYKGMRKDWGKESKVFWDYFRRINQHYKNNFEYVPLELYSEKSRIIYTLAKIKQYVQNYKGDNDERD